MANYIVSPNLKMNVPNLTDPGPDYATNISNALLNNIDPHNHDGVNGGVLINIAGQLIEGDLQLDGYNLGTTRTVEFNNQSGTLTGSQDVNCLYVNQNNLGFNDHNGTFHPLTGVNPAIFLNLIPQAVTTNFTILPNATYNSLQVNLSSPSTITLPVAAAITPTSAGRCFFINDVANNLVTNPLTIMVAGASGNHIYFNSAIVTSITLDVNSQGIFIYTDGISNWFVLPFAKNSYGNGEVLTLLNGATLQAESGSLIDLLSGSSEVVESGALLHVIGTETNTGTLNINSVLNINNASANMTNTTFIIGSGGQISVQNVGGINVPSGGSIIISTNQGLVGNTAGAIYGNGVGVITTHSVGGIAPSGSGAITDGGLAAGLQVTAVGGLITAGSGTVNISGTYLVPNGDSLTVASGASLAVNSGATATFTGSTIINGTSAVITAPISGSSGAPVNVASSQITFTGGAGDTQTLGATQQGMPYVLVGSSTLSGDCILDFGGIGAAEPGAPVPVFFVDISNCIGDFIAHSATLTFRNGGSGGYATQVMTSSSSSLYIVSLPSTTTVAVNF